MNWRTTIGLSRRCTPVRWHHIHMPTGQPSHIAEGHLAEDSRKGSKCFVLERSHLLQGTRAAVGCGPLSGQLCLLLDSPVNWKAPRIQAILLLHGNRVYWPGGLHACKSFLQISSQHCQATSSLNAEALRAGHLGTKYCLKSFLPDTCPKEFCETLY